MKRTLLMTSLIFLAAVFSINCGSSNVTQGGSTKCQGTNCSSAEDRDGEQNGDGRIEGNPCVNNSECGDGQTCSNNVCVCGDSNLSFSQEKPDIILALDISSSMNFHLKNDKESDGAGKLKDKPKDKPGDEPIIRRIDMLKSSLNSLVRATASGVRYGIVTFGVPREGETECVTDGVYTGEEVSEHLALGEYSADQLINEINRLKPACGTPTGKALAFAQQKIEASSAKVKAVILVTDGLPTNGQEGKAFKVATELYKKGIALYVIGIVGSNSADGSEGEEERQRAFLSKMVQKATGGKSSSYFDAGDQEHLKNVLTSLAKGRVGCTINVPSEQNDIHANQLHVSLNGRKLSRKAGAQEFTYDKAAKTITLKGETCNQFLQASEPNLEIIVSCACIAAINPATNKPYSASEPEGGLGDSSLCNNVDDNCDGQIDEGCEVTQQNECSPIATSCSDELLCCNGASCSSGICIIG